MEAVQTFSFRYDVLKYGRRVMITGVVVLIYPNSAAQIAITLAIVFMLAFTSAIVIMYWNR